MPCIACIKQPYMLTFSWFAQVIFTSVHFFLHYLCGFFDLIFVVKYSRKYFFLHQVFG